MRGDVNGSDIVGVNNVLCTGDIEGGDVDRGRYCGGDFCSVV